MNFLATTPSSRLVIAAPSWVDARRYALVKLRPEVTVEPTTRAGDRHADALRE